MDWEQHYLDNHTPWDKGAAAPPLLEWLERHPGQICGSILVPGCGLGHDSRALAANTEAATIVGLDISPEAVNQAEAVSKVGSETYDVDDLFAPDPKHLGAYDWIWEHTCFCAIEPNLRDDYVKAVWSALKPGGTLLAVFFLNPYDEEHQPGGGPPHGTSLEELQDRFEKSGRFREVESYTPQQSYAGREGLERLICYERVDS